VPVATDGQVPRIQEASQVKGHTRNHRSPAQHGSKTAPSILTGQLPRDTRRQAQLRTARAAMTAANCEAAHPHTTMLVDTFTEDGTVLDWPYSDEA
jgi:hypothetical protein